VTVMLFLTPGAFPWYRRCWLIFVHLVRSTVDLGVLLTQSARRM